MKTRENLQCRQWCFVFDYSAIRNHQQEKADGKPDEDVPSDINSKNNRGDEMDTGEEQYPT